MTITPANFTTNFPEFANSANYPPAVIQFYLNLGYALLDPRRWLSTLDFGVQFFVAHQLVLEYEAQVAARKNAPPGTTGQGPVSSQGAGPLSISWDTAQAAEADAGHWNLTTYGKRYIRMVRIAGMGGLQLGIGCAPPMSGGAWAGPPPWPGWFSN